MSRGHCFTVSCCGSDLHPFSIYSLHSFFIVYFSFFQKANLRKPANIKRRLSCTHCKDHETTKLSPQKPLVYFELLPVFFLKIYILRPYVKALLTLESFTPVKSIAYIVYRLSIDCIGNSPKLHQLREKDSLTFEDISWDQFITAHKQKPASLLSMSLLFVWASRSESLYFLLLWKHPVCIIYCLLSVCLRLTGGSAFVNIFLLSLFF